MITSTGHSPLLVVIEEDPLTTIDALAVVGHPEWAHCPTCHAPGTTYVERASLLPVAHADRCAALAAERRTWRDDLVAVALGGGRPIHRPVDGVEVDLGAALALDVDGDALARVEVVDGRRVRTLPLTDSDVVVTL